MHVELARGLIFYATGATWLSNLRKMQVTQRTGYWLCILSYLYSLFSYQSQRYKVNCNGLGSLCLCRGGLFALPSSTTVDKCNWKQFTQLNQKSSSQVFASSEQNCKTMHCMSRYFRAVSTLICTNCQHSRAFTREREIGEISTKWSHSPPREWTFSFNRHIREAVKYYFAYFVRKWGTPPPFTDFLFGKKGVTDLGGTPLPLYGKNPQSSIWRAP